MKAFHITVRTAAGAHTWIQLALSGAQAFMAAYDQFAGQPVRITYKEQRA